MAGQRFYETPTIYELLSLVEEVHRGELLIPAFQRPFIWTNQQRLDLLDSIRWGMPMGSVLVWRTESRELTSMQRLAGWRVEAPRATGIRSYLIDGHQRLMTLLAAFYEPAETEDEDSEDRVAWPMYYDLENERFDFEWPRRNGASPPPTWIALHLLRDNSGLIAAQRPLIEAGQMDLARRAETLRNAFVQYRVPVVPMLSDNLVHVALSFERINRGNTKMSELHLLHALAAVGGFDLRNELETQRERLPDVWQGLDDEVWLYVLKLSAGMGIYGKDIRTLANHLVDHPDALHSVTDRLLDALDFLQRRCSVTGPLRLPYTHQLVLLADAFGQAHGAGRAPSETEAVWWFWRTSLLQSFAGISESMLDRTVKEVREVVSGDRRAALEPVMKFTSPPNHRKESARLRCLRAIVGHWRVGRGEPDDAETLVSEWRRDPTGPHAGRVRELEEQIAFGAAIEPR